MGAWWTEEREKTASDMWAAGGLASTIGILLGCTANAVIGKMHRMGVVSGSGLNQPPAIIYPTSLEAAKSIEPVAEAAPQPKPKIEPICQPEPEPQVAEPIVEAARSDGGKKVSMFAWAPERCETLRRLFADGHSISTIARQMRSSRGTVRGKVKDLGLVRRVPIAAPPPTPYVPLAEAALPLDGSPVTFYNLEDRMCRWPVAEGYYCGASCDLRASYCDCHRAVSRGPGTPSERAAFKRPRVSALFDSFI